MKIQNNIRFSTALSLATLAAFTAPLQATESVSAKSSLRRFKTELSAPVLVPKGQYVGELQEKWQFPSDHLPIGMTLDGTHFASYNVMNNVYFKWVAENSQGLSRSMLAQENVLIPGTNLTVREQHTIDQVLEMLNHPTHPRSLVALQECGISFLEGLKNQLPPHSKIAFERSKNTPDQNVVVYDSRFFELVSNKSPQIFSMDRRPIQELVFNRLDGSGPLRVFNAHLPGDPAGPGRYEFGAYLAALQNDGIATIAMGDMNFNELEMRDALQKMRSHQLLTPYCTNIEPVRFTSKAIDHFILFNISKEAVIDRPEQVLLGLEETVALLETL